MLFRDLVLKPYQFVHIDLQNLGDVYQGLQRGLTTVGAPLADGCGVFAQLLCQPLVGVLFVGQDSLNSIQIFCHRESLFD